MGLFSGNGSTGWLGRYIAHVGAWGLLAIPFALIFATMLVGDLKNQLTLKPVEATVVAIRSECRLKWTEDGDSKKGKIRPCAEAERYRDESTKRLYRIDRDDFATVEWREDTGHTYRAELHHIDTGKIGDPEPGETVSVIARGGLEPKAVASSNYKDFTIRAALFAFCLWLAWPPRRPGNERAPFVYVRRKKGFTGGITEGIARWSFHGAVLGAIVACVGGWMFLTFDGSEAYASTEAQVMAVEATCRLSPDNGRILKIETMQKVACDRAEAIRRNRPEEHYEVLVRPEFKLRYTDASGAMQETVLASRAIRERAPSVGDVLTIRVKRDNPERIRLTQDDTDEDKAPGQFFIKTGGSFAGVGGILAWMFGLRIDLSRSSGNRFGPRRAVRRRT
jgi:hypothetical protein